MFTFPLSYGNQDMTKSAHWWSWSCDLHGKSLAIIFPRKYSRRPHRELQKMIFPYKQISGRNGDYQWFRMTNAVILCDLVWKVQKIHAEKIEGRFKNIPIEDNLLECYIHKQSCPINTVGSTLWAKMSPMVTTYFIKSQLRTHVTYEYRVEPIDCEVVGGRGITQMWGWTRNNILLTVWHMEWVFI